MTKNDIFNRYKDKVFDQHMFFNIATYAEVAFFTNTQLAWEYLRRNPEYLEDWKLTDKFDSDRKKLENALISSDLHPDNAKEVYEEWMKQESVRISDLPTKWGLLQLEPPFLPADQAIFQWSPDVHLYSQKYIVVEKPKWRGKKRSLSDWNIKHTTYIDENGFHVTARHNGIEVNLHGSQSPYLVGDEVLQLVNDPSKLKTQNEKCKRRVNYIFRDPQHTPNASNYSGNQMRHIYNLIALDGLNAGATHREIAMCMFREKEVESLWKRPDNHLKQTVKRSIKNGKSFVDKGYLKLLQAPSQ